MCVVRPIIICRTASVVPAAVSRRPTGRPTRLCHHHPHHPQAGPSSSGLVSLALPLCLSISSVLRAAGSPASALGDLHPQAGGGVDGGACDHAHILRRPNKRKVEALQHLRMRMVFTADAHNLIQLVSQATSAAASICKNAHRGSSLRWAREAEGVPLPARQWTRAPQTGRPRTCGRRRQRG